MKKKYEELCAEQWLKRMGYTDIQYISDTNKQPPDFVVDNRIGVEVRRLDWMTASNSATETIKHALKNEISKILEEARPPEGYDVYVSCTFHDHLPPTSETQKQIECCVKKYLDLCNEALQSGENPVNWKARLKCRIFFRFYPLPASETGKFMLVSINQGARRVGESSDNINRCIQEKTKKINGVICRHQEWWLVLVDCDFFAPQKEERNEWQQIQDKLEDTKPWSKIVVIEWKYFQTCVNLI